MIGNFNQIDRHRGEVLSVQGRSITRFDPASIEADVILWATGYELDLGFLDSPAPSGAKEVLIYSGTPRYSARPRGTRITA